jgi:hypothetical protein
MDNSAHVVIAHYNEDLEWVNNLKYSYTIITKWGIPRETAPNKGGEASCYLQYIIENYNNLSNTTIFLHGHRSSWHIHENIDEKVNRLEFNREYLNINDNVISEYINYGCDNTKKYIPIVINKIKNCLNDDLIIEELYFKQAGMFYVKKENILRHSKETYMKLYDFLMTYDEIDSGVTGRGFEFTWHYIFTGNHRDQS